MAQFDTEEIVIGGTEWKTAPFRFNGMFTLGGGSGQSYIDVLLSGVSPLALTNALGLNYIKALGATEQRNLPSGYTQVEYLESSGTQWIDLGYPIDGTISFNLKTRCLAPGFVFGSRSDYSNNVSSLNYDNVNNLFGIRMGNTIVYDSTSWTINTDYEIYISNGDIKINGTTVSTTAYGTSFYSGHAYLFTLNNNGVPGVSSFNINRIYYFQMFKNGVLTQNLIPCRRNSDNVLGMYDTVTGNFLTNSGTGTFTAGADVTTPSPDTPMDIICNNGVLKVSKNLFNETWEQGAIGATTGKPYEESKTALSTRIRVVNEIYLDHTKTYTISINNPDLEFVIQVFNEQHLLYVIPDITNVWGTEPITFTGAYGVAIALRYKNQADILPTEGQNAKIQLEQGSTATTYAPYSPNGIYTDGTQEKVEVFGKNLYNPATSILNVVLTDTGSTISAGGALVSDYILVMPNTTYTLKITRTDKNVYTRVCSYSSANESDFLSLLVKDTSVAAGDITITFTTDATAKYIRVSFKADSTNIQLELGSTATTYEPYYYGDTATAEMLLKVGDYQDNHELLAGNVTRNVGIKVLDGTEVWTYNNSAFLMNLSDRLPQKKFMFCTHFNYDGGSSTTIPNLCIGCGGTTNTIFIKYQTYNTAEQFKQYLADQYANGTPVIIVYPLATPTTEQVTGQSLTASGNCTVTATGSLDNLELELSYKQSI